MEDRVKLVLADGGGSSTTQRTLWELATRLPATRFDVRVWLPIDAESDELAAALTGREIEVERLAAPGSGGSWTHIARLWLRLRGARPDVLHLHFAEPPSDRFVTALVETCSPRHIAVSVHGPRMPVSFAARPLLQRALGRADSVSACCGAVAESLGNGRTIDRSRIHVVPPAVDAPDHEAESEGARHIRERFGAGMVRRLWLCAGRLEAPKGHAVFLEALARLDRAVFPFTALIAGEGPLRPALELRANQLGLSDRVHFLGGEGDPGELLAAADAVVIPSQWETMPAVLLEALVRGCPVIATATGGMMEAIENGATGWLVPPGDAHALAGALETAHRSPETARRMGASAAREACERYLWPRVVQSYEAIYDDALGLATFSPFTPEADAEPAHHRS